MEKIEIILEGTKKNMDYFRLNKWSMNHLTYNIRYWFVFALVCASFVSNGQSKEIKSLLDSTRTTIKGERLFNSNELSLDYFKDCQIKLEEVIRQQPNNAEAHYLLGYVYSKINSLDGSLLNKMKPALVMKCSEQLEKAIELSPDISYEIVFLNPYSKLTSEWGSLAMSYLAKNNKDSALWAFEEGRKRGGFSNYTLELNRKALQACEKNAILMSSGDNFTIPLWYLQTVEHERTDVSVVDINLLNSTWYPLYLKKNNSVDFGLSSRRLEKLSFKKWKEQTIQIKKFSWKVKPNFYDEYLLRGERLFLKLLIKNKFERDVYFTKAFLVSSQLNLTNHLSDYIFVDKLTPFGNEYLSFETFKKEIQSALQLALKMNVKDSDALLISTVFRYDILIRMDDYVNNRDELRARELLQLFDENTSGLNSYYTDEKFNEYLEYIRERVNF